MGCRFVQDIFIKYTIITLLIGFFARLIVSAVIRTLSIQPYPSQPESEAEAAEAFLDSVIHILSKKS